MSNLLLFVVIAVFAIAVFLKIVKLFLSFLEGGEAGFKIKNKEIVPYIKKKSVFTVAERSFYGVLKEVVGENADIFAKIRVADIITPNKKLERSDWQKAFNKISGKHFDFVICDKNTLSVLCVIELNDSSHNSAKRAKRDEFLDFVCRSAGIPLLFLKARSGYSPNELRQALTPYIDFSQPQQPQSDQTEANEDIRSCPKCGSLLVVKVAKKGKNQGKKFLACSNFPKCRYIEPID